MQHIKRISYNANRNAKNDEYCGIFEITIIGVRGGGAGGAANFYSRVGQSSLSCEND